MRLEWSGRAERGSAPHLAALVARCNDDGDEERDDDEADGGSDGDGGGGGDGGGPAEDARDGIRRVRASARRNLACPSTALRCTPQVQRIRCSRENAVVATHTRHGTDVARRSIVNFFFTVTRPSFLLLPVSAGLRALYLSSYPVLLRTRARKREREGEKNSPTITASASDFPLRASFLRGFRAEVSRRRDWAGLSLSPRTFSQSASQVRGRRASFPLGTAPPFPFLPSALPLSLLPALFRSRSTREWISTAYFSQLNGQHDIRADGLSRCIAAQHSYQFAVGAGRGAADRAGETPSFVRSDESVLARGPRGPRVLLSTPPRARRAANRGEGDFFPLPRSSRATFQLSCPLAVGAPTLKRTLFLGRIATPSCPLFPVSWIVRVSRDVPGGCK